MTAPSSAPVAPARARKPKLYLCSEIAKRIAARRGACNIVSVWRVIKRLKLEPVELGNLKFYSVAQADFIENHMRRANRN